MTLAESLAGLNDAFELMKGTQVALGVSALGAGADVIPNHPQ